MTSIPEPLNTLAAKIDQYHESRPENMRPHFGLSQLGNTDRRGQWLGFRWAFQQQFSGRILRLFRRGHREEETVVADLEAAGCELIHTLDDQLHIDLGSHVSGSPDGIIMSGVPEAPAKPHLLEIKTMSRKAFDAVVKEKLKKANPVYWVQVHANMYGVTQSNVIGRPVDRCLFIAVCKDDDRIYTERIKLDSAFAVEQIERGKQVALAERIPEPIFTNPSHWQAKWSPYYAVYFPGSATSEHWAKLRRQREGIGAASRVCVNCRTCAHSTPHEGSGWRCEQYGKDIPVDFQRKGCDRHALHPDIAELCEIEFIGGDGTRAEYRHAGKAYTNGHEAVSTELMLLEVAKC